MINNYILYIYRLYTHNYLEPTIQTIANQHAFSNQQRGWMDSIDLTIQYMTYMIHPLPCRDAIGMAGFVSELAI